MTRSMERMLRRIINVASIIMIIAASALLFCSVIKPNLVITLPSEQEFHATSTSTSEPQKLDARYERLAKTKMSKSVIAKTEAVAKPSAPDLSTLIRLKGIMSYGDPKDNEAIIELIRTGQVKTFKAGETILELNATILQVDSVVTVKYDDKTIKLEVKNTNTAERGSIAQPAGMEEFLAGTGAPTRK
jgi:hypothetical protein